MDIVGMIKKSYRGYGSLFSDKFRETFLKGDNKLVIAKISFFFVFFYE
jgi:hypothetical protein